MARKKNIYMILDCETATMPFADEVANYNSDLKKKIAIARPLIYDFAYSLMYRDGTIIKKAQYLISEIFSVPSIFNTAYYKDKKPLYLEMIRKGEIKCVPWLDAMEEFEKDLEIADYVGAFNSMFDFKKAIPFTELYISKLYSEDYYSWEKLQYKLCERIVNEPYKKPHEKDFDAENFTFRGKSYPLYDIWGMACNRLVNCAKYKGLCIENSMLTNSGEYFKTSAEAVYRFLRDEMDFEEAHTALADAEIESAILAKMLKRGKVDVGIDYFPFRSLGYTTDFVLELKNEKKRKQYAAAVIAQMLAYCETSGETAYQKRLMEKVNFLRSVVGE